MGLCPKSLAQISGISLWLRGGDHFFISDGLWVMLVASNIATIGFLQAACRRFDPAQGASTPKASIRPFSG